MFISSSVTKPCCSFNLVDLATINSHKELFNAVQLKIKDSINVLQELHCHPIQYIYIGKSSIPSSKKTGLKFNPQDPKTWNLSRIQSRWSKHKKTIYGKDGMIILLCLPQTEHWKHQIPQYITECGNNAQDCVLTIEHQLHNYYSNQFILWNRVSKYKPGRKGTSALGYVLYVTYSFTRDDNSTQ